ncbi:MAG: hypothetical protein E6J46_12260 [Chloroflexi bacterium]|nr:MAG: hypothetical protein AUH79_07270 [Betaproteobacteria bacterium 13_1_40CM_4_64_4]TMB76199.1 MAG: hypothetical protein E6J46_12260 [Chloroflexota bacterium]
MPPRLVRSARHLLVPALVLIAAPTGVSAAMRNLVSQLRKRLFIGAEGLYGLKETNDRSESDVYRFQLGMVYSIFD